ncbi:MAG TPA: ATP-binding protein [Chthoniobacteraceae bacterium]|nr:ATP-binding protein [Chthoniobacteraceae bacterium]
MSELNPRQVRALILLLIVAPLIPACIMLQLMMQTVRAEHEAAEDRAGALYEANLRTAAASVVAQLKAEQDPPAKLAARADRYFNQCFARDVKVRLLPPSAAGNDAAIASPLAEVALDTPLRGWKVELFQNGFDPLDDAFRYEITFFALVAGAAILLNIGIAGVAGFALSRQMRVHELKSTSLEIVSHELRTPLASTRVLLDTLLAKPQSLPEPAGEYVRLISDENLRLIHLAESFLTLARLERGNCRLERHPIAPAELFRDAVRTARARLNLTAPELQVDVPGNLPDVLVDREAMTVALANLIDNAVKYSSGRKEITLRAMLDADAVEFQVIDHGIGIARAEQKRIFDRFYQVNQTLARAHQGCGLGLSIVKSIVQAHGGKIRITSAEGLGTTVGLLLPAA